jgi:hypothetical protein
MGTIEMKISTLMLASLMTLTSAAIFAADGSERSRGLYDNSRVAQQIDQRTTEKTAFVQTQEIRNPNASDQSITVQAPDS